MNLIYEVFFQKAFLVILMKVRKTHTKRVARRTQARTNEFL